MNTRGFSLIELIVSMACGTFLLAAAAALTSQHTHLLGRAADRTESSQAARLTVDLLAQDLRMAGVGVGYRPDGSFAGLERGDFTVSGGASFSANDFPVALRSGASVTDDIGVRHANGRVRTIGAFNASSGQICAGSNLESGDLAILMTREGMHARTIRIGTVTAGPCTGGVCIDGCETFAWAADATYQSDAFATSASYVSGELIADFSQIVWFVTPGPDGIGQLRRAEVDTASPCNARNETCGGLVAPGVETVQLAVWQWDSVLSAWAERTNDNAIVDRDRIRVDVEIVVRGSDNHRSKHRGALALEIGTGQCLPAPCGTPADGVERRVLRTSIEVRNAGRLQIK